MASDGKSEEKVKKNRSVLDDVPVKDNDYHLRSMSVNIPMEGGGPLLEIVGACPRCGSPVYGRKRIGAEELPTVRMSCACAARPRVSIQDTVRTT